MADTEVMTSIEQDRYVRWGSCNIIYDAKHTASGTLMADSILHGDIVVPSDMYIILAIYYSGVATIKQISTILSAMSVRDPEKHIPHSAPGGTNDAIAVRIRALIGAGAIYKILLTDKENPDRYSYYYSASYMGIKFARIHLELAQKLLCTPESSVFTRREIIRRQTVAAFTAKVLQYAISTGFSRDKRLIYLKNNKRQIVSTPYMWLKTKNTAIEREIFVLPIIFTPDPTVYNEDEEIIGRKKLYQYITDLYDYSINTGRKTGAVLIVDNGEDLGRLLKEVRDYCYENGLQQYVPNIMITSLGIVEKANFETTLISLETGRVASREQSFF